MDIQRSRAIDFRQSDHLMKRLKYIAGTLSLLLAPALLLTVAGSIFDHHFAERSLEHHHLYVGGVSLHHTHLFQVPHTHAHGEDAASASHTPQDHACVLLVTPQMESTMASGGLFSTEAAWAPASAQTIPRMRVHRQLSNSSITSSFTPLPEPHPPRPLL